MLGGDRLEKMLSGMVFVDEWGFCVGLVRGGFLCEICDWGFHKDFFSTGF